MKIAVIAAEGRSGRMFCYYALKAGHTISAGVYGGAKLPEQPNMTQYSCDATRLEDIEKLLLGCDAVVSLIGHTKNTVANVQTKAIENVIHSMQNQGINRLVSLTGTGVRVKGDTPSFMDKLLNFAVKKIDPERISDGINHAELIRASGLDWTIIRVLKLQDTNPKKYTLTEHGPAKIITSRDEVATAILEVLEKNSFIQKLPVISR